MTVRCRFAPAPSGSLHVGNVRSALFSWLWARHNEGVFILRVEDTDASRVTEEAFRGVLEDLQWLGLDWDEGPEVGGPHGPYRQSERATIYRDAADRLLASGAAYRCFCTPEELESASRQRATGARRPDTTAGAARAPRMNAARSTSPARRSSSAFGCPTASRSSTTS